MKKALLGLVAFVVVYVSVAAGLAVRAGGQNAAFRAQLDRLDELGTKTASALEPYPSETLAQSCKAVPEVKENQVLAYFTKTSLDVKDMSFVPQRALQLGSETMDWPWRDSDAEYFMYQLMSDFPPYWPMYLDRWDDPFNHDPSDAKYLVVHVLTDVTRPRMIDDQSYEAGELKFNSAVVDVPTGKVLCAGTSVVTETGDVHVTGHGKTDFDAKENADKMRDKELLTALGFAASHFGLGEVCWIGGEWLCKATFHPFVRPE